MTRVQILYYDLCISHSAKTLGKVMHPTILLSAMGKIVGQTELFCHGMETNLGERKLNLNLLISALNVDLVWYPAHGKGIGWKQKVKFSKNTFSFI